MSLSKHRRKTIAVFFFVPSVQSVCYVSCMIAGQYLHVWFRPTSTLAKLASCTGGGVREGGGRASIHPVPIWQGVDHLTFSTVQRNAIRRIHQRRRHGPIVERLPDLARLTETATTVFKSIACHCHDARPYEAGGTAIPVGGHPLDNAGKKKNTRRNAILKNNKNAPHYQC